MASTARTTHYKLLFLNPGLRKRKQIPFEAYLEVPGDTYTLCYEILSQISSFFLRQLPFPTKLIFIFICNIKTRHKWKRLLSPLLSRHSGESGRSSFRGEPGAREFSGKSIQPKVGGPRTEGMNFSSSPGGPQRQ